MDDQTDKNYLTKKPISLQVLWVLGKEGEGEWIWAASCKKFWRIYAATFSSSQINFQLSDVGFGVSQEVTIIREEKEEEI